MRPARFVALALALLTVAPEALAQRARPTAAPAEPPAPPPPPPPTTGPAAEADALIEEGLRLRTAGRDDDALVQFQRAYERSPSPRALAQTALAEQAIGRWAEADEHLTEALTRTSDPFIQRNRAALEQAHAIVRTHVGQLEVRGNVPEAELFVGTRSLGTVAVPRARSVPVGSVTFVVRAAGYAPVTRTVNVVSVAPAVPLAPWPLVGVLMLSALAALRRRSGRNS